MTWLNRLCEISLPCNIQSLVSLLRLLFPCFYLLPYLPRGCHWIYLCIKGYFKPPQSVRLFFLPLMSVWPRDYHKSEGLYFCPTVNQELVGLQKVALGAKHSLPIRNAQSFIFKPGFLGGAPQPEQVIVQPEVILKPLVPVRLLPHVKGSVCSFEKDLKPAQLLKSFRVGTESE